VCVDLLIIYFYFSTHHISYQDTLPENLLNNVLIELVYDGLIWVF